MSVDIEPSELSFQRPFTFEVSQTLSLRNPNATPVAFKVKTTAPKQYCVRPNAGRIEPGQSFDVTVLLQAMKQEPPADAKCRDKFLVQSAPITGDKEFASIASVFDTTEKSSITERKIRVNWLAAADNTAAPPSIAVTPSKQTNGADNVDTPEASRTFASPSAGADSPSTAPPPYTDTPKSQPEEIKEQAQAAAATAATSLQATAQSTVETVKEATRTDSVVRQRVAKGAEEAKKATGQLAQAVPQQVHGVSVPIVAMLCFLSFLVAYFFF